jgi:hypothetical protein
MLIIVLHKEQLNKILKTYIILSILTWDLRLKKKDKNALMRLFLAKHMWLERTVTCFSRNTCKNNKN